LFRTDADVDDCIARLKAKRPLPERFGRNEFHLGSDGELHWQMRGKDAPDLIVVRPSQVQDVLKRDWDGGWDSLGMSVESLYKRIRTKYIGITRDNCQAFLQSQPVYQMAQRQVRHLRKPILASACNQVWQCDLIDMTQYTSVANRRRNYIMVCVDVFSRYCWLEALVNKDEHSSLEAFRTIIARAGIAPRVLRTDNGLEFKNSVWAEFCAARDIKQIFSLSHTPTSNGIVERTNLEVRRLIARLFTHNANTVWEPFLQNIAQAKNASWNRSIKSAPVHVYIPERPTVEDDSRARREGRVIPGIAPGYPSPAVTRAEIVQANQQRLENYQNADDFHAGDQVRVRMSELFSNVRRVIKAGNSKQIVVMFTPTMYRVERVIGVKGGVGSRRYILQNANGDRIMSHDFKTRHFRADALQRAQGESTMSLDKALRLNQVERSQTDCRNLE
jgi:transposase InsO family protein